MAVPLCSCILLQFQETDLILALLAVTRPVLFSIINGSVFWNQFGVAPYYCGKKIFFSPHWSCTLQNSFFGYIQDCIGYIQDRTGYIQDHPGYMQDSTGYIWLIAPTKISRTMPTRSSESRYICFTLCFKSNTRLDLRKILFIRLEKGPSTSTGKRALIMEGWGWSLKGTHLCCDVQGAGEEENYSHFHLNLGELHRPVRLSYPLWLVVIFLKYAHNLVFSIWRKCLGEEEHAKTENLNYCQASLFLASSVNCSSHQKSLTWNTGYSVILQAN